MHSKNNGPVITPIGRKKYARYLGVVDVWAIAFGCIVGWGAFVMPGTTFLPISSPIGSVAALVVSTLLMLIVGNNYSYLMKKRPGTGGVYSYTKDAFGRDHAFICSWFLSLSYLTVVFLNATALFVMSRTVFGNMFQFGIHYQVAGYDIYFGELVLSTLALAVVGLLFIGGKPLLQVMQTVLAVVLFLGVMVIAALCIPHIRLENLTSGALNPDADPFVGFITIVLLAPWAFVGFDVASLETAHFRFPIRRSGVIIALSIIFGGLTYIALTLLSISDIPSGFSGLQDYISNLDSIKGIPSIPPFFAAENLLGSVGVPVIVVIACAAIFTGIIGAYRATARMLSTMAQDNILSKRFLDTPFCILFIMLISIGISFFGRNALVWYVDLTSFGAIVGFGYTSGAAWKKAAANKNRRTVITGAAGTVISVLFLIVHLVSKISEVEIMGAESFLMLALWCLLGFLFYWRTIRKSDPDEYSGNTVTGTVLFCLLLYSSLMWYIKSLMDLDVNGNYKADIVIRSIVLLVIVATGLAVMLYIQSVLQKKHNETWRAKIQAEESSKAKSTFLFNISHDIRTPMNAIIGYTHILMEEKDLSPNVKDYIEKIDISGKHLLTLINDVLEMSLIESGKLELNNENGDLTETVNTAFDMFRQQMGEKKISYTLKIENVDSPYVVYDRLRFMRVILNLLSNAYKFTSKGGAVSVSLRGTESPPGTSGFELRVKDNGIGMTKEFAETVFEAFERERNSTVSRIQGTGLGMAITKSIIDAMNGRIEVNTAPGEGTEFIITVSFETCTKESCITSSQNQVAAEFDYSSKRLLLVDDIDINRQIASMLLTRMGFRVETAENGAQAVEMVEKADSGYYDAVLTDIQMPVMNGYEATKRIRELSNREKSTIPIIAVTANAFGEDVRLAHDAGMNAHIAKPIDPDKMRSVLVDLLS